MTHSPDEASELALLGEKYFALFVHFTQVVSVTPTLEDGGTPCFVDRLPVDVKAVLAFVVNLPGTSLARGHRASTATKCLVVRGRVERAVRLVRSMALAPA